MFAKTLLVSLVSCTLLISGCSSNSGGGFFSGFGGADPDPRLAQYDVETSGSSYASSCAIGAGVAGFSCLLMVDKEHYAACIAAAAAGCAVFMGGNAILDSLRTKYHTREQQLNGLIEMNTDLNKTALQMAQASKDVYLETERKIQRMQEGIKTNQVSREQIVAQIEQNEANAELLQKNLETYEESLTSLKDARRGLVSGQNLNAQERKRLRECDRQIAALQTAIDDMRASLEGFVSQRNVLQVGLSQVAA